MTDKAMMKPTKTTSIIILIWLTLLLPACTTQPMPTSTPTPAASATPTLMGDGPITPHPGNPVLPLGAADSWDSSAVFSPRVILKDGIYHMFYNGSADDTLPTMAIGYATSSNGWTFTRQAAEPILTGDERGFDARQVNRGVPLLDGDQWVLYYNAGGGQGGAGKAIGRATAHDPIGPWKRNEQPVLLVGDPEAWDADYVVPESVLLTDEGYVLYYTGGNLYGSIAMIGMATSSDGITWKKRGEPVLRPGPEGSWDGIGVWGCAVLPTEDGWEMFYTGGSETSVSIGYATSPDGINWNKHEGNPILSPGDDPATSMQILQSPSVIKTGATYVIYYDYGVTGGGIGLAIGDTLPH